MSKKFLILGLLSLLLLCSSPFVFATNVTMYSNISFDGGSGSETQGWGWAFAISENAVLAGVQRGATVTATRAYIFNTTGTMIGGSGTLFGDIYVFNNITLLAGRQYFVLLCSDGSAYSQRVSSSPRWPETIYNSTFYVNYTSSAGRADCRASTAVSTGFGADYNVQNLIFNISPPAANFTITASDFYTAGSISNFSALVSAANSTLNFNPFSGLQAWYTLDSNTQSSPDLSGNGNTGTLNGWTWNNGIVLDGGVTINTTENAIQFDGASGTKVQASTVSNMPSNFTAIIIIKSDNNTESNNFPVFLNIGSNASSRRFQYLGFKSSGSLQWKMNYNGSEVISASNALVLNGSSHFVGFTYNGTHYVRYLDSYTSAVSALNINALGFDNKISIGGAIYNGSSTAGLISGVYIFNRSLNSTEMDLMRNMNGGEPSPVSSGLFVQWLPNAYNGTTSSPQMFYDTNNLGAGQINGSGNFDGALNQYVQSSNLNFSTPFSVCAWSKNNEYNVNSIYRTVASSYTGGGTNRIFYLEQNSIGVTFRTYQDGINSISSSYSYLSPRYWTHSCGIWNGTHQLVYSDGVLVDSDAQSTIYGGVSLPFRIGRSAINGGYNGSIDDVRIYNRSLSGDEVRTLYLAGAYRIYNYSTTNGTINTGIDSSSPFLLNISLSSTENGGYFDRNYTNVNMSSNLNAQLIKTYLESVTYLGNYTYSSIASLVRNLSYSISLKSCWNDGIVRFFDNGQNTFNASFGCSPLQNVTLSGVYNFATEGNHTLTFDVPSSYNTTSRTGNSYTNFSTVWNFTADLYDPVLTIGSNYSTGFNASPFLTNFTLNCLDTYSYFNVYYRMIIGNSTANKTIINSNTTNGLTLSNATTLYPNTNHLFASCSDIFGTTSQSSQFPASVVFFSVYNLTSLSYINTTNVSIILSASNGTVVYGNSTNGTVYFSTVQPGTYTVTAYAAGYNPYVNTLTVGAGTYQTYDIYMSSPGQSQLVMTIYNRQEGTTIEDATIIVDTKITPTSPYSTIATLTSDITGSAAIYYSVNTPYQFTVSADGFETRQFSLVSVVSNTITVLMEKTTAVNDTADYQDITTFFTPRGAVLNLNTTNFTYTIGAPSRNLFLYNYTITTNYDSTRLTGAGTNAFGETLNTSLFVNASVSNAQIYFDYSYFLTNGFVLHQRRVIPVTNSSAPYTATSSQTYGVSLLGRIIITILLTIFGAGVAYWYGGSIASGVVSIAIIGYLVNIGFAPLWGFAISLIVLIMVVYEGGKK